MLSDLMVQSPPSHCAMNAARVKIYDSFVAAMATSDLVNLIGAAAEELANEGL